MTNMTFDDVVELVERLSSQEQTRLTTHLLELARKRQLSVQEKMKLLRSAQIDVEIISTPSPRREDWYDDDGC